MLRVVLFALATLVVAGTFDVLVPAAAEAQARGRRRGQGVVRARRPQRGATSEGSARARRRRARTRRRDRDRRGGCVGCAADLLAMTGLGLSTGIAGGYVHGANNGVWSDRVGGGAHLDPGPLLPVLLDTRAWMPIDRFRWGVAIQVGPTAALDGRLGPQLGGDAFEPGSRAGAPMLVAYYGLLAYQPALSEHVQLWLGARFGAHHLTIPIEVDGRAYATVERLFFSAGPELGVWIGEGFFGWTIQAFVDVAQPGVAQLVTSFAVEIPPNRGEAY